MKRSVTRIPPAPRWRQGLRKYVNVRTLASALWWCSLHAHAQQAAEPAALPVPPDAAIPAIEIQDVRDPYLRPYRTMLKGAAAFAQQHQLAPHAELRFILRTSRPNLAWQEVSLRLAGPDQSIAIPIADDHTFALPVLPEADVARADLVLNQKKETMRWRPHVRTPGLGPNQRRVGDLRLECAVLWAIEQGELSFLSRNALNLTGGLCGSPVARLVYLHPEKLESATLVSGQRRLALRLAPDGKGYLPPLKDASVEDDALIELQPAAASAQASERVSAQ